VRHQPHSRHRAPTDAEGGCACVLLLAGGVLSCRQLQLAVPPHHSVTNFQSMIPFPLTTTDSSVLAVVYDPQSQSVLDDLRANHWVLSQTINDQATPVAPRQPAISHLPGASLMSFSRSSSALASVSPTVSSCMKNVAPQRPLRSKCSLGKRVFLSRGLAAPSTQLKVLQPSPQSDNEPSKKRT
jgi:hypothetical protein